MKWVLVVGIILLLAIIPNIYAADTIPFEYNQSKPACSTPGNYYCVQKIITGGNFHSPKIACAEDDGLFDCAFLYYDNETAQVYLGHTGDAFANVNAITVGSTYDVLYNNTQTPQVFLGNASLPYDIIWDSNSQVYNIIINYKFYTYNPNTNSLTFIKNIGSVSQHDSILNFIDSNSYISYNVSSQDSLQKLRLTWLSNSSYQTLNANIGAGSAVTCANAFGWGAVEGTTYRFYLYGFYELFCDSFYPSAFASYQFSNTSFTPSTNQTGIDYYNDFSDYLIYRNVSAVYGNSIFKRTTSDLNTFGSEQLYYTSNLSADERFYQQDSYADGNRRIVIYQLGTNSSGNGDGIYVSQQYLRPINVINKVQNWNTGAFESISTTSTITCSDQSYNQTASGSSVNLGSPCFNANENYIIFTTTTAVPSYYNLSLTNDLCVSQPTTIQFFYVGKSNYTYKIIDNSNGSAISGATITIDGSTSKTTNANGETYFSITPVSNSSIAVSYSDCLYTISSNTSSLLPHSVLIEASGYNSVLLSSETFALGQNSKVVQMNRLGTTAKVRLYTQDGIELFPSNITINANSTQQQGTIYLVIGSQLKNQSTAYELPVQYFFANITPTSFDVTFDALYSNGKTYSTTQTLITNTSTDVNIFTDFLSTNQYCNIPSDCAPTHCSSSDSYYDTFLGCVDNICQYNRESCTAGLCDDRGGCFNEITTEACIDDYNCTSSCLSTTVSSLGFCTEEGVCANKDVTCGGSIQNETNNIGNFCNSATGRCAFIDFCFQSGTIGQSFRIITTQGGILNPLADIIGGRYLIGPNETAYVNEFFECGILTRNDPPRCIQGALVPKNEPDVFVQPIEWQREVSGSNIHYFDVAVKCKDEVSCKPEYEFCQYGCYNGLCKQEPISSGYEAGTTLQNQYNQVLAFFPTPELKMVAWSVLVLLAMAGLTLMSHKWQLGMIAALILVLIGTALTFYPVWIGFAVIIISALVGVSKFFGISGGE